MIPKTIHYCWFGMGAKPADFLKYLEGWKKKCPDYELHEWNESNFDVNINAYCREAYLTRNYAHVSDVCRMWTLYQYGGVYLDTDVEVVKPFDQLLHLDSFVGVESDLIGTGVIGSKAGAKWLGRFMDYYEKHHFLSWWGHARRTPNTKILTRELLPAMEIADYPTILPKRFFTCPDPATGLGDITLDTFAVHYFAASWRKKKTLRDKLTAIRKGLAIRYGS